MQLKHESTPDREREFSIPHHDEREPYIGPTLEHLGSWSALTLEQSVGIAFLRALLPEEEGWRLDEFR